MAVIESRVVINAPPGRVWEIVSDLDAEPKFWKGTKSVRNKGREGDVVIREITLAFKDKVCEQRVRLNAPTSIVAEFTRGIISGSKTVNVRAEGGSATELAVRWDMAMTGLMSMFTPVITRHVRDGTEAALGAIKREAEGI